MYSNKNKNFHTYFGILIAFVVYLGVATQVAFGNTLPSGQFIVQPARVEASIAPGEKKTVALRLANGTPYPLHVDVSFEDIAPNSQTSAIDDPVRLLGETHGVNSLKDSFLTTQTSFDVLTAKEVVVPIEIAIPSSATPGGRYGSVIFTFRPALPSNEGDSANIAVSNRVAVMFYVRIEGEAREEGSLAAFGLFNNAKFVVSPSSETPLRFQVAFENTGDVYVNPHGAVTVTSMLGKKHTALIDPFAVLPGAVRMREIDMHEPLACGYYSAQLSLARGYGDEVDTKEVHFFVLPTFKMIIILIVAAVSLFFLIRRSLKISRSSIK